MRRQKLKELLDPADGDGVPFFLGTLPHCSGARLHPWLGYFPKKKTLLNSVVSLGFELKDQGRERGESSNFHRPPFLLNRPEKEKGKEGEGRRDGEANFIPCQEASSYSSTRRVLFAAVAQKSTLFILQ